MNKETTFRQFLTENDFEIEYIDPEENLFTEFSDEFEVKKVKDGVEISIE